MGNYAKVIYLGDLGANLDLKPSPSQNHPRIILEALWSFVSRFCNSQTFLKILGEFFGG